ncbi:MAG: hypothetical protein H6737_29125 [Alphaproteobacteria bacterium]|nr:hypothetical protein [Alphaproteobacteria bacterium]
MRLVGLALLLPGCARGIWDARQFRCEELDAIEVSNFGYYPTLVTSSLEIDEDCEVKTQGIRRTWARESDGTLFLDDVHRIELEIDPATFATAQDWPELGFSWTEPGIDPGDYQSRVTGETSMRLDFVYGPALPRVHVGSTHRGVLGYGRGVEGFDGDGETPGRAELRVDCRDCFVNIRANGGVQVQTDGLATDLECRGSSGLCTYIRVDELGDDVPANEICVGPTTPKVFYRGGSDDNVKIVVLGDPGEDFTLQSIDVQTGGTVAVVVPDLNFHGQVSSGVLTAGLNLPQVGQGPELNVQASLGVVLAIDNQSLREGACESGLPVLDVQ